MSGKREGYISWDEYFMGVAELSGMRSKDPICRWEAVLSVRTIKYSPWAITVFLWAARTMSFPGQGRGKHGYQVFLCNPQ